MVRFFRFAAALFLLPTLAHAGSTGALLEDLDAFERRLRWDAADAAIIAVELLAEENKELFPLPEDGGTATGRLALEGEEIRTKFVTTEVDGKTVTLTDVPRQAWFAPYVRFVADAGIVSGYRDASGDPIGLYGPGDNVTVEEMAKMAVLAAGIATPSCPPARNASAQGGWGASFVGCAENAGWAVFADAAVPVQKKASRAEVVVTLLQAMGAPVIHPDPGGEPSFTDVPSGVQFSGAIERAKRDGIVSGYAAPDGAPTGTFGPSDPVTRAEIAKILALAMQVYGANE